MNRREEIRKIHKTHRFFYEMLGGAVVLGICVLIGAGAFGGENVDYRMNLFTEGMGIVATVFMINRWYSYRERESLKRRLIREAGSRSHDIAISAVEWMEREGWLRGEDGLLRGANLREARLWDARMDGANLEGANLYRADLRGAKLENASMGEANIFFGQLQGAILREAHLHDAKLDLADLSDAHFDGAQLRNAKLSQAILKSANLNNADFEEAFMLDADLTGASVFGTCFNKANLMGAKLKEARWIRYAKFRGANLNFVDLKGVNLGDMDLRDAELQCTNLQNASLLRTNLQSADLRGAYLEGASIFLAETRLKTKSKRSSDVEWTTEEVIKPGTNLLGATLPDGKVFTEEMDFEDIEPYINPNHEKYPATLKNIEDSNPGRRRN